MALEEGLADLRCRLAYAQAQVADNLLWVITENKPDDPESKPDGASAGADHYLADHYEAAVLELLGLLEATEHTLVDVVATEPGVTARALVQCQRDFQKSMHHFSCELISVAYIEDLTNLACGEASLVWNDWVENVKVELARCQPLFMIVDQALMVCWQAIAERVAL